MIAVTGNYTESAKLCNISRITIQNWMKHDQFLSLIEEKKVAIEAKCFNDIYNDPAWTAKAWILERLKPEKWGPPKQRIQNINLTADDLTDEELAEIAKGEG